MDEIFPNRDSLKQIMQILEQAAEAIGDKVSLSLEDGVSKPVIETAGGFAGLAAGVAAGAGMLFGGAAPGLVGAAALTNGLAGAGALIGGGMAAGIGVVAAPAVILGVAGAVAGSYAIDYFNDGRLHATKEAALQEVIRLREALSRSLPPSTPETRDHFYQLIAQLKASEINLTKDLQLE